MASAPITPEMAEALGWAANDGEAVDHSPLNGAEVVGQILLIPTRDIDQGERLRDIDPVWAEALGHVMQRERQRTPIEVCRLPGQTRWTLVAGGHRHAGALQVGIEYLRAEVVSANRDDRRMREVSENLWHKGLGPIDRAAFIAEAVAIHKRRAGIDPTADGRVASANARWQKAVSAEAADATETISVAYGWSDQIGEQLGFTGRTIRNDLMLFRRLAPSVVARLKAERHPLATNATQLRALAKLDRELQAQAVDALLRDDDPARSVGEAIKAVEGRRAPPADPETKRLSAFIGSFQRMTLAEKRGALLHLIENGLIPHGFVLEQAA